jgi:hypothetical protein
MYGAYGCFVLFKLTKLPLVLIKLLLLLKMQQLQRDDDGILIYIQGRLFLKTLKILQQSKNLSYLSHFKFHHELQFTMG